MSKGGMTPEVQAQHYIEVRENLSKEVISEWDLEIWNWVYSEIMNHGLIASMLSQYGRA